jgi:hypothetical protein
MPGIASSSNSCNEDGLPAGSITRRTSAISGPYGKAVVRLQMFVTWDEALEAAGLEK